MTCSRRIERIVIVVLSGSREEFAAVSEALAFVDDAGHSGGAATFEGYEATVRYSNGDRLDLRTQDREELRRFLTYSNDERA